MKVNLINLISAVFCVTLMTVTLADAGPRSDSKIHRDLIQKIQTSPTLRDLPLQVNVRDGMVALRGRVATRTQHASLLKAAQSTRGVTAVHNVIYITQGAKSSDQVITQNVLAALRSDPQLDYLGLMVQVQNKRCHISGQVITQPQLKRARRVAKRVSGVSKVSDSIAIENAMTASGTPLAVSSR